MNDISPLDPTIPGAVWRYKWLVLFLVMVGAVLGVAWATFTSPVFTAKAELIVEDPGAITVFDSTRSAQSDRYTADQVQILDSPAVENSAEAIVLTQLPDFDNDVSDMSTIDGDSDSSLITIRVSGPDKQEAQIVANALVAAYQQVKEETAETSAEAALAELDASLAEVDNQVLDIQARVAVARSSSLLRADLDGQFTRAVDRIVALQDELADTTSDIRAAAIRLELSDLLLQVQTYQEIQSVESTNPTLSPLIQELESTIARRSTLETRRDEIAVDSKLVTRGISLTSPAPLPKGDGREATRAGIIGAVAASFLAMGAAYSIAIRRRSFTSRAEPEIVIDAPIISEVPRFADEGITSALPVQDMPQTRTAEAFRFAAAALDIQSASSGARSLVVISGSARDGKTTVLANAAMAAAREGNRVLVVDADFGSQNLSQLLVGNIPPATGITEVVETGADLRRAIVTVPVADGASLNLLSRGHRPVIAANFFRSAATRVFFEGIRDEFDLVLIDTPPLLHVAYTSIISRYADGALLVVNHGGAVSELEEVVDRLEFIGTKPVGYIYNRSPLRADQTDIEGSLKDILGGGVATMRSNGEPSKGLLKRWSKVPGAAAAPGSMPKKRQANPAPAPERPAATDSPAP
ncbi:MAG: Wzz/FepE/Etk N-terminal domain-containing protein [Acidimicrobiia bacterium]|nr:Wzz/FepE/Etk N-terminal domain-containing protein [Acidimicrobiia bacterium]